MTRYSIKVGFANALIVATAALSLQRAPAAPGGFTELAGSSGLSHTQFDGERLGLSSQLISSGGAAVGDYDNDGWLDLFVTRLDGKDILYRNQGGETPPGEQVTFLPAVNTGLDHNEPTNGAAWADIDRDGDLDLYISTIGGSRYYLYINNGDGTFTEDAVSRGLALESALPHQGQSVSFGDYDLDGWLDIHTTEWGIDRSDPAVGNHSVLMRNRGTEAPGSFVNVTEFAGVELDVKSIQYGFSSSFSDLDLDGWPDLAVTGDFFTPQLFWNNGDGTFTDGTEAAGVNKTGSPMGTAIGDYNRDGLLDWFVTAIDSNRLYTNNGDRTFTNFSDTLGVEDGDWGWGAAFIDIENDGDLDIMMTNGFLHSDRSPLASQERAFEPMRLWRNDDGLYNDISEEYGVTDLREGRALVTFDYDNDGDLDVYIANNGSTPTFYRNDIESGNNWLRLKLNGVSSNIDGIGARVELIIAEGSDPLLKELTGGNDYLGQSESIIHYGLGPNIESVRAIQIRWPSGIVQILTDIEPNQTLAVTEPEPDALASPFFNAQSGDIAVQKDDSVELTVAATGNPEPAIVWYKDGEKIEGAVGSVYRIEKAKLFAAGSYTAEARNTVGTTLSAPMELSIDWDISHFSVARAWNEVLLDAIRKDFPAPTIHSRNLYHVSAAIWDAFWAYEENGWDQALPAFHKEEVDSASQAPDLLSAQREAISYAAYRVLVQRYEKSAGADYSLFAFDWLMNELGYDPNFEGVDGDSPAAVGNRIGYALISQALSDGSNEENDYADTSGYVASNDPLVIRFGGTMLDEPNRWQPLAFDARITQNGILIGESIQEFIGVNWRAVDTFALEKSGPDTIAIDPGGPPLLDSESQQAFLDAALEVIRFSSYLDPNANVTIDVSPGAHLNNRLGRNGGPGRSLNPVTEQPYAPNVVNRADYGRILAEFWADGPESETPPGHWNTLHNEVVEDPLLERRYGGVGPELTPLSWDVQAYLTLNGAMHDAAIAAWALKRQYDYVRPISIIRHLGALGQSSDPNGPSYHPQGLPLESGLVEVITEASAANGQRHAALSDHIGAIAIYSWAGEPDDPDTETGGVAWILAADWLPYQRDTFVTPAFAAYVSGHSTFSRAAAEVMTLLTGTPYFPGGIGAFAFQQNDYLEFEAGPSEDVTLQWATYYDAADQAGISRLYGGIHVRADDLVGRRLGARIGLEAFIKAHRMRYGALAPRGIENVDYRDTLSADGRASLMEITRLDGTGALPARKTKMPLAANEDAPRGIHFSADDARANGISISIRDEALRSIVTWPGTIEASSDSSLRFEVVGEQPKIVFARLLGESASSLVSNSIASPTLTVHRLQENGERVLVASNEGWTDAERASLLEVASQELGLKEIALESSDSGVFLFLEEGNYEVAFGNNSNVGTQAQFELYLLD